MTSKWLTFAVPLILLSIIIPFACNQSSPQKMEIWVSGSSGPLLHKASGRNCYVTDLSRHPDFGIVFREIENSIDSANDESEVAGEAISLCRQHFSESYYNKSILAYDEDGTMRDKWSPTRPGLPYVPFHPKWIVIIVSIGTTHTPEDSSQESIKEDSDSDCSLFPVAFVCRASDVFNVSMPLDKVVKRSYRSLCPIKINESETNQYGDYEYRVIEDFRK